MICPSCNGEGVIETLLFNGNPVLDECTRCEGTGWLDQAPIDAGGGQ